MPSVWAMTKRSKRSYTAIYSADGDDNFRTRSPHEPTFCEHMQPKLIQKLHRRIYIIPMHTGYRISLSRDISSYAPFIRRCSKLRGPYYNIITVVDFAPALLHFHVIILLGCKQNIISVSKHHPYTVGEEGKEDPPALRL